MLSFDEIYSFLPGDGWLSETEARLLWDAVNKTVGDILEVGCYMGRSTVLFAKTGRFVRCVDPFDGFHSELSGDEIEAKWRLNTQPWVGNVQLYRQRIEDWSPIGLAHGFAYLDGDHTYIGTLAQILKAKVSLQFGGAIAIHDVNDTGGGAEVKRAAHELLGPWTTRVERLAIWENV